MLKQVRYNSAIFTGLSVIVVPGYPTRDVQKFAWTGESVENAQLLMKQETYDVQYPLLFSLPHVTCPKQH
ncbi:Oidioi.mRNA.OKI2018_I69.chr1.g2642.t1.cds [Oikopleura dioica]|uniref:Oidioi.mRNA.OKI2018_I69.chr1.g2642.t1.cds n=1 Tax=Oikopleura dioica TaxID=34765 RepID=A0ABN7SRR0_OIKDI|nr:Oidioi.mRNA.OKI2018_I69.chr1.g2642.t1.cds [Oikopleura dioica]